MPNPSDVSRLLEYRKQKQNTPALNVSTPAVEPPRPEVVDWTNVDPRLDAMLSTLGYTRPGVQMSAPKKPAGDEGFAGFLSRALKLDATNNNFAGRPGAYITSAMENDIAGLPKVREKGGAGAWLLENIADPVLAGLNALWEAYARPTIGMTQALSEQSPEFKKAMGEWVTGENAGPMSLGALYTPERQAERNEWFDPEKGSVTRTVFDVATGLPRLLSNVAMLPAAYKTMAREGIKPSEVWKEGYTSWENLPENVKSWSYLVDPLDVVGGAVGKLGKAANVLGKGGRLTRWVSKIPGGGDIIAPAAKELRKFTEPIVERGGALKTAEELGIKAGKNLSWNPQTWKGLFKLSPESQAVEKMVNAVDYTYGPLDTARRTTKSADAMGQALDEALDATIAMSKPDTEVGSVARSQRGQETLRIAEGFSGAGKQMAEEYKAMQPRWEEAYRLAGDTDVNEFLRAARADKAHPFHENANLLSKVPRNLEELQYRMLSRVSEYTGEAAAKAFGVSAPGAWNLFNNVAKTAQSYLFLATSPVYAALNVLNNLATALFHDVGAITDIGKVRDKLGLATRAKAGLGVAGVETGVFGKSEDIFEAGRKAIRKAAGGEVSPSGKFWRRTQEKISAPLQSENALMRGLTSPMRVAQWAEQRQGEMATAVGTLRSWYQLWKEGKAIPAITDPLLLNGLQEAGLLDDFNALVRSSMNPTELAEALYKQKGKTARQVLETLNIPESDKAILRENYAPMLDRMDKATDRIGEAQKILYEQQPKHGALMDAQIEQVLDFDKRRINDGQFGAIIGTLHDIDDSLTNAYQRADDLKDNFFRFGGEWEVTKQAIDDTFNYAFELTDKRIEQMRGWLKDNGFDGENWFINQAEWKKQRDAVVKAVRDLKPEQRIERRQAWTNYFAWLDGANQTARRTMLSSMAQTTSPEIKQAIEQIVQAEAEATTAYRAVLDDVWQQIDTLPPQLSPQDIRQVKNRLFAEAANKKGQIYQQAREVRQRLYGDFAGKVNDARAAPITQPPAVDIFSELYNAGEELAYTGAGEMPAREALEARVGRKLSEREWEQANDAFRAGRDEGIQAELYDKYRAAKETLSFYNQDKFHQRVWLPTNRTERKTAKFSVGGDLADFRDFAWYKDVASRFPDATNPDDILNAALDDYNSVRAVTSQYESRYGKGKPKSKWKSPGPLGKSVEQASEEMQRIARDVQYKTAEVGRPKLFEMEQPTPKPIPQIDTLNDITHPNMAVDLVDPNTVSLDSLQRILPRLAEQMMVSPVGDYSGLAPEVVDALIRHVQGNIVPAMEDARLGARKLGEWMRDQAMLNYNRRYGYNQVLGYVFPYEFWFTTSLGHWARKFIQQPELLAIYARMKETLSQTEEDLPERLRGMVSFNLPFLPDWMGDYFVDPLSIGLPFQNFLYPIESASWGSEREQLEKDLEYAIKSGAPQDEIDEIRQNIASIPQQGLYETLGSFMSPGLQWKLADILLNPDKDWGDLEPLMPGSRFWKGITSMAGVNEGQGVDIEAGLRERINKLTGANLPTMGAWDDYLISRMLSNMAQQGEITNDEAQRAMIEKTGDAWEKAKARAAQETGAKTVTPWRDAVFPVGEKNLRGVYAELSALYDSEPPEGTAEHDAWKEKRNAWYDAHPEYSTKQMTYGLPGEQYRDYLGNYIWDEVGKSSVKYKVAWQMFEEEMNALKNKTATTEQLARLANALGIDFPKMTAPENVPTPAGYKEGVPEFESAVTDEQVERFGDYLSEIEKRFGKDIYKVQTEYYNTKDENESAAKQYLGKHPELKSYWDFARNWKEKNQDIARIAWPTTTEASTNSAQSDLLSRVAARLARRGYRR